MKLEDLQRIENTVQPTAGMGLVVDLNGLIPTSVLPVWQTYTPALGGAAAIGDGTIAGRYVRLGNTVVFSASVTFGTTTSLGAGVPTISLPVTGGGNVSSSFGWIRGIDVSAGANYAGTLLPNSTTVGSIGHADGAGAYAFWTTVVPFAWASTDLMFFSGTYEAA